MQVYINFNLILFYFSKKGAVVVKVNFWEEKKCFYKIIPVPARLMSEQQSFYFSKILFKRNTLTFALAVAGAELSILA